jgi:DNA-binding MarR family transcriptional regulator
VETGFIVDLFVVDQHLGALLDAAIAGTGLTASTFAVYTQLERGALTPRQLSEILGIKPTTLSGYLATMQRHGHLSRAKHQRDARSSLLQLTEAGRDKVRECRPAMRRATQAISANLGGAEEVRAARELIGRIDRAILAARATLTTPR